MLLTIAVDHIGDFLFRGVVQEIRRALTRLTHPHVKRTIGLKGKTAIGPVKLHRGNTDIQRHTRNAGYAAFLQQMFHFGKAAFDERQRAALCSHKRMPFGYGIGIAVEGKRSEEHTSELQSLMRISYAVFCLKKK